MWGKASNEIKLKMQFKWPLRPCTHLSFIKSIVKPRTDWRCTKRRIYRLPRVPQTYLHGYNFCLLDVIIIQAKGNNVYLSITLTNELRMQYVTLYINIEISYSNIQVNGKFAIWQVPLLLALGLWSFSYHATCYTIPGNLWERPTFSSRWTEIGIIST